MCCVCLNKLLYHIFYERLQAYKYDKCKGAVIPVKAYYRSKGFQEVEAPRFLDSQHKRLVRSALRNSHLYPPGNISGTHFS